MNYVVEMQVGYHEDDDVYHGPFVSEMQMRAGSLEEVLRQAHDVLRTKKAELAEPDNMTDGLVLNVRDETGKLRFNHALGILKEEATRAETEQEAKLNIFARLNREPELGRRARRALQAASKEAIKELLGPVGRIVIAAVEAWHDEGNGKR